jgi:hypothetical protein
METRSSRGDVSPRPDILRVQRTKWGDHVEQGVQSSDSRSKHGLHAGSGWYATRFGIVVCTTHANAAAFRMRLHDG